MNDRERLIKLLRNHCALICHDACPKSTNGKCTIYECATCLADHLLANGVIVPPVKVGERVYRIDYYLDCDVDGFGVCDDYDMSGDIACGYCRHNCIKTFIKQDLYKLEMFDDIGETVFLTREEAEAALKEGK